MARRLSLFLAFAVLVLLAWFTVHSIENGTRATDRGSAASGALPDSVPARPRLEGLDSAAAKEAEPARPDPVEDARRWLEDHQRRDRHPPVSLNIGIRGVDGHLPDDTKVRVILAGELGDVLGDADAVIGTTQASAAIAPLLDHPGVMRLFVWVDVPGYVPADATVYVPAERPVREDLHTDVRVRPARVFAGRVVDERGEPLPGCDVGVRPAADGRPFKRGVTRSGHGEWADATRTDAEGDFQLRVRDPGSYVVLVHRPDRPLASRVVMIPKEGEAAALTMRMPTGHAVTGVVTLNGEPARGAEVRARIAESRIGWWSGGLRTPWGHRFGWSDAGPVAYDAVARTDEKGRFRIDRLPPVPHVIEVLRLEGVQLDSRPLARAATSALPPTDDVTVAARLTPTRLSFFADEAPCTSGLVRIERDAIPASGNLSSPADFVGFDLACDLGRDAAPRVHLEPGSRYTATWTTSERRRWRASFEAPASATPVSIEVALEPVGAAERPDVLLELRGPDGAWVEPAPMRMTPGRGTSDDTPSPSTEILDGRIAVYAQGAGRWILTAGAARSPTWFLPLETAVTLPTPRTVTRVLDLRLGGRLRIAARDASGACLKAVIELRTEDGAPRRLMFEEASLAGRLSPVTGLGADRPSTTATLLEPGRYTLTLRHEGHERTRAVEVHPGRTTEIEVRFER